jgi:hypothetical protein
LENKIGHGNADKAQKDNEQNNAQLTLLLFLFGHASLTIYRSGFLLSISGRIIMVFS